MTVRDSIRSYPLAAFFVLAYAFSWTFWLGAQVAFPPDLPPAERVPAQLLGVVGTFGPLVAAVVVARATGTGSELWGRLLQWRVAPRWYVVTIGLPVVAVAVAYAIYRVLGGPPLDPSRVPSLVAVIATFVFTLVAGGGNEEPGWRGFALPPLQDRFGALGGTLVLAALWAGWHLPAFLDPASTQSLLPPVAWTLGVGATALILTWLFNRTGGSVPVVALYHASFNVAGLVVIAALPAGAVASFYWAGVLVYGTFAVGLLFATRTALGFARRASRDGTATRDVT